MKFISIISKKEWCLYTHTKHSTQTSVIPSGRALAQLVSYIAIQNVRFAKLQLFDGMVRNTSVIFDMVRKTSVI